MQPHNLQDPKPPLVKALVLNMGVLFDVFDYVED